MYGFLFAFLILLLIIATGAVFAFWLVALSLVLADANVCNKSIKHSPAGVRAGATTYAVSRRVWTIRYVILFPVVHLQRAERFCS